MIKRTSKRTEVSILTLSNLFPLQFCCKYMEKSVGFVSFLKVTIQCTLPVAVLYAFLCDIAFGKPLMSRMQEQVRSLYNCILGRIIFKFFWRELRWFQGGQIGEPFIEIKLIIVMKITLVQMANNFLFS